MLLCDLTDIFVSIFRIVDTMYSTKIAISFYICMFISWIYLRMYHYAVLVVWPIYNQWKESNNPTI